VATLGESVVGTAVYGPVRTVVWEDGGREAPSYPIVPQSDDFVRGWLSYWTNWQLDGIIEFAAQRPPLYRWLVAGWR
jgi:hypothetical protein